MPPNSRHLIAVAAVVCAAGILLADGRSRAEVTRLDPAAAEAEGQASSEGVKVLIRGRRFVQAESMARELLAEAEETHGPDSLEAARAIDLLVSIDYRSAGVVEPAGVMELAERAVDIKEKLLGPDHEELIPSLGQLARLLNLRGYYDESLALLRRNLHIRESRYGPDHLEVADSLNNLAAATFEIGDLASTRMYYERALAIVEKAPEPLAEPRGLRFNYGRLLYAMGDYEAARSIFESAAKRRRRDADPRRAGGGMCTLGSLLRTMGEYETARPMIESGLDLLKQGHGPRHHSVAWALTNLADLLQDTGDLSGAGQLYEEALEISQEAFGPDHPSVAGDLRSLGLNLLLRGDLDRAEQRLEAARTIQEEVFGASHIQLAQTHVALARLHWAAGRSRHAFESALRAEEVSRNHFRETSQVLSEREALRYELILTAGLDTAFTALLALDRTGGADGLAATAWGDLIGSRAMVLDEMVRRHRTVMSQPSSASSSLLSDLAAARNRLSRLQLSDAPTEEPSAYRESLRKAQEDKDRLERALAAGGWKIRKQASVRIGLGEVAAALPDSSALVAFLRFDRVAKQVRQRAVPSYVALVQWQGARDPVVVALGEAERIDRLIQLWREAIGADPRLSSAGTAEAAYLEAGSRLREAVWDPVASSLAGAKQAFIVPDGALNFISFGALPVDGRRYLVETGPTLHYLSAERDLLRDAAPRTRGEGLLALGAPDFDAPAEALMASSAIAGPMTPLQTSSRPSGSPGGARRNARASCGEFGSMKFGALPGSGVEVDRIASIWRERASGREAGDDKVIQLTGPAAAEAAFKRLAPGRKIVHLATHGFFADGTCESNQSTLTGRGNIDPLSAMPAHHGDNPLLLSGLALAGANRRDQIGADTDAEDGVLTAEEIGSLDLSNTEWAVLSACETGLGRLMSGEGVLGLRRAFEVAGAGTLIMSLWQVEDDATRVWMSRLYEGRLTGLSTSEAVRQASTSMIEDQRRRGGTTHPFFWGGFVAAGDWR